MKVCFITATKNRHKQLERVVRFALNQTYPDWVQLIYNNSQSSLRLNVNLPKEKFILVNSPVNVTTHKPYDNLGDIYMDAMKFVPEDCDVINFMDDDDIYLSSHAHEGVKGLIKGGKLAYKPQKSWYKHGKKTSLVENNLEPSIFVYKSHIQKYGFSKETTAQHLRWLDPLVINEEIFIDPEGIPTYICDWSQDISTFKTSGDPNNPNNFTNYTNSSNDVGDGIITPCNESWAKHYYKTK